MNPYRDLQIIQHEPFSLKKRSKVKTFYYRLQIKLRGKWRDRFIRCEHCLEKFERSGGDCLDLSYVSHRMNKHWNIITGQKIKEQSDGYYGYLCK